MKVGLLAVAGWLVAAVLMVGVSWSAISVVRTAVVPRTTVAGGLPVPVETPTAAPTAGATPTTTPTTTAGGRPVLATGRGGSATVRCVDGTPRFVNVTPRQGYSVHRDDGPGEVRFDGPSGARTEITATCAGDTARTGVEDRAASGGGDDDDSGGGDDDGGDDD